MKKLLLIGSNGMLGTALRHVLSQRHAVSTLDRTQFDISGGRWDNLSVSGFDYVINAAGLISRRRATDAELCTVNAVFPQVLSALCARHGVRYILFSTDCVFDGVHAPFYEDSPRLAQDAYGKSKALGEPNMALVLRTSIIGPECRNFYNLLCWTLAQSHIDGFTDHLWNGVTTLEAARVVDLIIQNALFAEGVRHIFAEDCSKYDLVQMICRAFGHPAQISPAAAPAPRDTRLRTNYPEFLQVFGIHSMQDQLRHLLAVSSPQGRWITDRSVAE
ncbi:MAG: NAD-dependent epimerase/dehydratase family protein [Alphaproteobacteria bacterium]|nr:NAD-dependent epimerase/dehydratase family protein [Alphaproteobacteria bacterium]